MNTKLKKYVSLAVGGIATLGAGVGAGLLYWKKKKQTTLHKEMLQEEGDEVKPLLSTEEPVAEPLQEQDVPDIDFAEEGTDFLLVGATEVESEEKSVS